MYMPCICIHTLKYTTHYFDRMGRAKIVELNKDKAHALCSWVGYSKASDDWVELKYIVSASVCR